LSRLTLIRHGQAGTRADYDTLSELGRCQAFLLGERLVAQRARFDRAYSGTLQRQLSTARIVEQSFQEAGLSFPEIVEDPRWDEFDLDDVYAQMAPPLCRDDETFARGYDEILTALGDDGQGVHRRHHDCDIKVVRAWTEGLYDYEGESWPQFRERILSPLGSLREDAGEDGTVVFTSATPIGIWSAQALGLDENGAWRLTGVSYNSAMTSLRLARGDLRLFSFNSVPHLVDPELWSFR